eukprot:108950_1
MQAMIIVFSLILHYWVIVYQQLIQHYHQVRHQLLLHQPHLHRHLIPLLLHRLVLQLQNQQHTCQPQEHQQQKHQLQSFRLQVCQRQINQQHNIQLRYGANVSYFEIGDECRIYYSIDSSMNWGTPLATITDYLYERYYTVSLPSASDNIGVGINLVSDTDASNDHCLFFNITLLGDRLPTTNPTLSPSSTPTTATPTTFAPTFNPTVAPSLGPTTAEPTTYMPTTRTPTTKAPTTIIPTTSMPTTDQPTT